MNRIDFIANDIELSYLNEGVGGLIDFVATAPVFYKQEENEQEIPRIVQSELNNEGSLNSSVMQMLKVDVEGKANLQGSWLEYKRTVEADSQAGTINHGIFRVIEQEYSVDEDKTTLKMADPMIKTHKEVHADEFNLSFPTTLGKLFKKVADICELETDVTSFRNSDLVVNRDEWTNTIYTYRNILDHIAQITGLVVGIKEDKLDIWGYEDTGLVISEYRSKTLDVGEEVGKFNILNVTQEPQHDNSPYPPSWIEIPIDERVEYVLANNPIADYDREFYSPIIFDNIKDLNYTEFEADTFGWGIFDIGDVVTVKDLDGNEYKSIITSELGTFKQAFHSTISSSKIPNAKDEYVVATDRRREGQRVYLIVDQQEGKIQGLIEKTDETEDRLTDLTLDVEGIKTEVASINTNANLILNLSGTMGTYDYWTWEGTPLLRNYPTLVQRSNLSANTNFEIVELANTLSRYGLSFFATGKAVTTYGFIIPDTIYSFRAKRVSGDHPFIVDVREFDKDYKLIKTTPFELRGKAYEAFSFEPNESTVYAQLAFNVPTATYDSRLVLSDMMFNRGNPKEWQENAEEIKVWASSEIKQLDNEISSTVEEIKIVDGKVVENKSMIDQLSGKIVLAVDSEGRIVEVELGVDADSGSVFIVKADNIKLEGYTTINGGFKILPNGNVEGVNVKLSGEINATSGKIGNYTITQGSLVGNDVTLGNRIIKVGPATLERATIGNEEALAIRSYFLELGDSSKQANWIQVGGRKFVQGFPRDGFGVFARNLLPDESTTYAKEIGTSSNRWDNIYLKNQPNVSSDLRYKNLITAISDDLLDVVHDIKPKQYYTIYDNKVHFGYIAQDVERALYKHALRVYGREKAHQVVDDFAMLSKDESYMSLLYGEIQVLKDAYYQRELDRQKEVNNNLQEQIDELKEMIKNGL